MSGREFDVVIVGAGNAALTAALSAREHGAKVLVLERAPYDERGGNSRYTAGAIRFAHNGLEDLLKVMPDLTEDEQKNTNFGIYSREEYFDDMARMTRFRCDPDLAEILIDNSLDTLIWMGSKGVKFQPSYGRQAFKVDGRFKFWGGLCLETWGGGPGLIDSLLNAIQMDGIEIFYSSRAMELILEKGAVRGVVVSEGTKTYDIRAKSVVLASGGFEANTEWRTRYLGPGWDLAPVRGTRFNTGDGIRMALDIGAVSNGNWSGCHAVGWDRNAPPFGDLAVGDGFQKHSYPLGIMVNSTGRRFVDEGADFRNYTYAKYGHEILRQPGQFAWQVFDAKVSHMLRDEYRIRQVTKVTADTIEELSKKLEDVDADTFVSEVKAFNDSVRKDVPFDPSVKDGRCTEGLNVPKSHWANPLDEPPYEAYAITCGITFTFGGLKINNDGQVMNSDGLPISGLYAAGELIGGLFYFNYPGGTGLMSGAVFGRISGSSAGKDAVS